MTRHIIPTQDYLNVIPAKVHYCPGKIPRHSREGGTGIEEIAVSLHCMNSRLRGNDQQVCAGMTCFLTERSSIAAGWIPACAGMTDGMDFRLRGNDQQVCAGMAWLVSPRGCAISGLSSVCRSPNISQTSSVHSQRADEISGLNPDLANGPATALPLASIPALFSLSLCTNLLRQN